MGFKNVRGAYMVTPDAVGFRNLGEGMKDPNIVFSGHCGPFTRDGVSVEVSIARLEHES